MPELIAFAKEERIALTVVGPEAPLAAGIVDAFQAAGSTIFGPTKRGATRSSKDFAKVFMARHRIPTACTRRSPTRRPRSLCRRARRADRGQGRRPRRGQGRGGRGRLTAKRSRDRRDACRQAHGRRWRARRDRGMPRRRGGELHRDGGRTTTCRCSRRPRTTSACRTATAGPTPAAWAHIRRRRW